MSLCYLVPPLEALHPPGCVHYPLLPGEERMALAANLDLERWPGGSGGKSITTGTNRLGIGVILGMDLLFHYS